MPVDAGLELWGTVAGMVGCTRVAQRRAAVSADEFRRPNIELLLGSDAVVEHVDNGIRSVDGLLTTCTMP